MTKKKQITHTILFDDQQHLHHPTGKDSLSYQQNYGKRCLLLCLGKQLEPLHVRLATWTSAHTARKASLHPKTFLSENYIFYKSKAYHQDCGLR